MIKQSLLLTAALIFTVAAFSQNDEKANVLAIERNTADAFTKHNAIYINQVFTDDATIVTSKAELINKQQLIQYMPNINSVVVSDMVVKILGATAIVTGVETETGKNDAGVYTAKYRYTDVLQKVKGNWMIVASQATSMDQQQ
jgi:ketosteroid isomerase-like protein